MRALQLTREHLQAIEGPGVVGIGPSAPQATAYAGPVALGQVIGDVALLEAGVLVLQDPQPRFKLVMTHLGALASSAAARFLPVPRRCGSATIHALAYVRSGTVNNYPRRWSSSITYNVTSWGLGGDIRFVLRTIPIVVRGA